MVLDDFLVRLGIEGGGEEGEGGKGEGGGEVEDDGEERGTEKEG